jgi:hypothetical protein
MTNYQQELENILKEPFDLKKALNLSSKLHIEETKGIILSKKVEELWQELSFRIMNKNISIMKHELIIIVIILSIVFGSISLLVYLRGW